MANSTPSARFALVSIVLLALAGCAAVDLKMTASQPAPDWVYLHPGAKVGDRAVWKNPRREHQLMIWEVVGQHGEDLEVTLAWQDERGSGGSEQSGIRRHFIVGRDGTVKRAFARNFKTGETADMRVADKGEVVTSREIRKLDTPQRIETPAGSFLVDQVMVQHFHYKVMVTYLDNAAVEFIDPNASFGVVRSIQDIDIGGLALAKLTATVGRVQMAGNDPLALYNALKEIDLTNQIKQSFDLVEMRK